MPDVDREMPNEVENAVDAPYSPKQKRSENTYAAIIAVARNAEKIQQKISPDGN